MNKTQKEARLIYNRNRDNVQSGVINNVMELSLIAKQQDVLYKVIHERQDNKFFRAGE